MASSTHGLLGARPQMTGAIVQILPGSLPELRSPCRLMASTLDPRTGRTVMGNALSATLRWRALTSG